MRALISLSQMKPSIEEWQPLAIIYEKVSFFKECSKELNQQPEETTYRFRPDTQQANSSKYSGLKMRVIILLMFQYLDIVRK